MWISGRGDSGVIVDQAQPPRSYVVSTPTGIIWRNRRQLTQIPQPENDVSRPGQIMHNQQEETVLSHHKVLLHQLQGVAPPKQLISDPNWNS